MLSDMIRHAFSNPCSNTETEGALRITQGLMFPCQLIVNEHFPARHPMGLGLAGTGLALALSTSARMRLRIIAKF